MIREIIVKEAITYEYPPDGGEIPIIDPYDGCTMGCPYCFQLNDDKWNENLFVKVNMPDLIKSGDKMVCYIKEKFPQLEETYLEILYKDEDTYIDELKVKWANNSRVKVVFD